MENIKDILKSCGIELDEEKQKAFDEKFNANYKTVSDYNKQKEKLELANTELSNTKKSFDDFKKEFDGVDVNDLKNKVDTLTKDLETKESEYQTKLSTLDLKTKIKESLKKEGCLDLDLAMSQFNIDDLLASKNQETDLQSALDDLKTNKSLLFQAEDKGRKAQVGGSTGGENGLDAYEQQLRASFGLDMKGE